ncbi:hypothetical protein SAMN04487895_101541 [Paenibacillus sophorae]|uniref:Uncharacterized protein n=1 Tax=Paenibacillus sophorae TaxID=1333845 RepID=A0A1H8GK77_9BACL|nr:hypothetical protein [Paenibacillus sophorae]QWU14249.1 hypothetical protein KP014_20275 [Paenibacillus sophorae]SEN44164.1 hypothetical protein SAMN04487895_101541 [Paenibacillus sophorae]
MTVIEKASLVFIKIDDGIYYIHKDRKGKYSGRCYAGTQDVLAELEIEDVVIVKGELHGRMIHCNFKWS